MDYIIYATKLKILKIAIKTLRKNHFLVKQKPVRATAFQGKRIAWLYNRDIGTYRIIGEIILQCLLVLMINYSYSEIQNFLNQADLAQLPSS